MEMNAEEAKFECFYRGVARWCEERIATASHISKQISKLLAAAVLVQLYCAS